MNHPAPHPRARIEPSPELLADRVTPEAAPAPPSAQTFAFVTDTPHLTRVTHHSLDGIKFEVIDRVIGACTFKQAAPMRFLSALLRLVSEHDFATTGRLACEASVPELVEITGLGRATIYKAAKELVALGLIEKHPGGGRDRTSYEVMIPGDNLSRGLRTETARPPARSAEAPQTTLTPRQRAPYDAANEGLFGGPDDGPQSTCVDPRRALMRRPQPSTHVDPRRAPMCRPQPSTLVDSHPSSPPSWTPPLNNEHACTGAGASAAALLAAAASEGGEEKEESERQRIAAATTELLRFGIPNTDAAAIAAKSTTTDVLVVAAELEIKYRKPPAENPPGLLIWMLRDPGRVSLKYLDRARVMIAARNAPPPAPPAPKPPDPEAEHRKAIRDSILKLPPDALDTLLDRVLAGTSERYAHAHLTKTRAAARSNLAWLRAIEDLVLADQRGDITAGGDQ